MRICIICHMFPTAEGKGGYFFVEQLVNEFAKQGHQCSVISPVNIASKYGIKRPYGPLKEVRTIEGAKPYDVYRPRYYGRDIRIKGISWARYECRRAIEGILNIIKDPFDAIYCHFFESGALAFPYAQKHSIPLFVASGESQIQTIVKSTKGFSLENFRQYISGVVCVSTKNKEEASTIGLATPEKCIVLPNGVNLNAFRPMGKSNCRKELGFTDTDFIITCIGNFSERKGQDRIIEAFNKIGKPNIKIILGGQGKLNNTSDAILYSGFIDHEQIPKYLSASDVYVIPTRWEGCCNSIIEAMACGLPIISSNRPFNWDVLNKDNSIMIDPDNIDEIAKAILTLYEDESLRERLSKNAYRTAQNLSISRRAQGIVDFMNDKM